MTISRAPTGKSPLIVVEDLSFSYSNQQVLRHCSLSVDEGSFTALVGDNGTGKSTLIRLIIGELRPSSGSVRLIGYDPRRFREWRHIGYVPQDGTTNLAGFPATVVEVVRTGLYASRGLFRPLGELGHDAVVEALQETGIEDLAKRKLSDLSGGQRQRVLLARALAGNPALLILDEPTASLDDRGARDFFALVADFSIKARRTVLMVTHELDHASSYADHMTVLDDGSLSEKEPLLPTSSERC